MKNFVKCTVGAIENGEFHPLEESMSILINLDHCSSITITPIKDVYAIVMVDDNTATAIRSEELTRCLAVYND